MNGAGLLPGDGAATNSAVGAESDTRTPAGELLRRSLSRGRLGHAYLFLGDDLGELEQAARHLASLVNCSDATDRAPDGTALSACGRCSRCRRIAQGNHPDVTWVRPESKSRQISADQTRELIRIIGLRPTEAVRKVAVLVGADRMHTAAANAFLKTLEEPPAGSVLILLSTEPDRLLETILSRCLRLNFGSGRLPADPAVTGWLATFAERTATAPPGSLLGRYELLGTLLTALTEEKSRLEATLTAASPLERYPDASPEQKERWEGELAAAIEAEYRRRRADFTAALGGWLRDVWLAATVPVEDLALVPALAASTRTTAARLTPAQARDNLDRWGQTQRILFTNVQEALALEVGLLRLHL